MASHPSAPFHRGVGSVLSALVRDLRLAWRGLKRRPGFFALVVLVLATGIGSAVAAFGVLEATQLRPIPFTRPGELIQIALAHESRPLEAEPVYRQDLLTLGGRQDVVEQLGEFGNTAVTLGDGVRADRIEAAYVSPGLFPMLGIQPAAGRSFRAEDAAPGAPPVVLISHELWTQHFDAAADIVGRDVRLDRRLVTIVGVMPDGFAFPYRQRLWLPLPAATPGDVSDTSRTIGVARMAAGVTLEAADEALSPMLEEATRQQPDRYVGYRLRLQPLSWFFVDWQARAGQRLLFLAVLAILLLAIVNAAGLMLAHARKREGEWALRWALGAPRADRLIAGLAAAAIVSATSLILALPFARAALIWLEGELLQSEDPSPYFLNLELTPVTIGFAVAAAALAAGVAGLIPGLRLGATGTGLSAQGPRVAGSRPAARLAGAMVAVQIALSLVVIAAMAVMAQGVERMGRRDLGVDPAGVLTARLALPAAQYPTAEDRAAFWLRLADALEGQPGLVSATVATDVPGFTGGVEAVRIEGAEVGRDVVRAAAAAVDPKFVETYRIPLAAGRNIGPEDDGRALRMALVDRRFAEAAWPDRDPIGRRIRFSDDDDWMTVAGLVQNLHLAQVDDPPRGTVLVPLAQYPSRTATIAVRTSGDPYSVLPTVRATVAEIDGDLPVYLVYSLTDAIRQGYYNVRIFARVIGWLSLSALLMTGAGLYALLSGRVTQRAREIGIRRALGAGHLAVSRTVAAQVIVPLAAGTAVGQMSAMPVAQALVAIEPTVLAAGSGTFALALGTLVTVVVLALVAPLVRALAVNPIDALRCE